MLLGRRKLWYEVMLSIVPEIDLPGRDGLYLDGGLHKILSGSGTARVHSIMCEIAGYTDYGREFASHLSKTAYTFCRFFEPFHLSAHYKGAIWSSCEQVTVCL